jgi:hypothetical protein
MPLGGLFIVIDYTQNSPGNGTGAARLLAGKSPTTVLFVGELQAGMKTYAGRMLELRPLMQANLLRNFSVAVEQTLIILPCLAGGQRRSMSGHFAIADQRCSLRATKNSLTGGRAFIR